MGGGRKISPTLALEPNWRTRPFSTRSKVLQSQGPSQPTLHDSYQYLQPDEDLWITNLLMDVGVSRTKVDARPLPAKLDRCVSSQCSCLGKVCASQCSGSSVCVISKCQGRGNHCSSVTLPPPTFWLSRGHSCVESLGGLVLMVHRSCDSEDFVLGHILGYPLEFLGGDLCDLPPLLEGPLVFDAISG